MDINTNVPIWISILLMLPTLSDQQPANSNISFKVSPGQIVLGGLGQTNRLSLTCSHPGGRAIQAMEVGKILDNKRKKMATLQHGDRGPEIVDDSIRKRASSSGIITGVGGSIHISLYQLMCDDRGTYYCRSNSTHNRTNVLYRNVTVTATPHIPYMRVTPRASRYHTGLDLHIRCSGRVGSQFNSSFWRWEWRSANESSSWTDYPHLERIRHERPSQDPVSKCELQAASTLTHTITDLDECRRIRCSIGLAKYSDEVTIRLLDTPHQCSQDGQPSLHHATLTLLVCTVSSLLVTGLGVTALLCLTLRRRRAKLQDAVVARSAGPRETGLQFISYPSVDTAMYGDSLKAPVSDSIIQMTYGNCIAHDVNKCNVFDKSRS